MFILNSEKAARIARHGGSLSSRLPSGIATRCRRLEVVVEMRVITGDGLELHGMMARHGEREGRAKARALLPIVV
jgi:hypothetical protein